MNGPEEESKNVLPGAKTLPLEGEELVLKKKGEDLE